MNSSNSTSSDSSQDDASDSRRRCEQALVLWLRWNDAYERMTSQMFEHRENPERVEELLGQVDELRRQGVDTTKEILRG